MENRLGELAGKPTVRVFTKANEDFSLSIREGNVVLVPTDQSDLHQVLQFFKVKPGNRIWLT